MEAISISFYSYSHFILILIHIIRGLEGMSGVRSLVTFKRRLD